MINVAIADTPIAPPTCFEREAESRSPDTWQADPRISDVVLIGDDFGDQISSSSCLGTLKNPPQRWLESSASTASWIGFIKFYIDLLQVEKFVASVNISNAPENLFELRRLTGFTWTRLAKLLNVERRTLNNWVKGAKIREQNRAHIAKTLEVLRFVDRGSAELNAAVLGEQRVPHGPDLFEAIRGGDYETAKWYLPYGLSRPHGWQTITDAASRVGEFQSMVMHVDADGTEVIEPLPDEPAPGSRKRPIKRG